MLNKSIKYICFFFYTWCIYQSYFFIAAPMALYEAGDEISLSLIKALFLSFFFIVPIVVSFIQELDYIIPNIHTFLPFLLPLFLLYIIYSNLFIAWWKNQTLAKAWVLALTGMFMGPGLALCIGMLGNGGGDMKGVAAIFGINLFYFLLYLGNRLQKKYWPANKFCNKLRSILLWPCLRT